MKFLCKISTLQSCPSLLKKKMLRLDPTYAYADRPVCRFNRPIGEATDRSTRLVPTAILSRPVDINTDWSTDCLLPHDSFWLVRVPLNFKKKTNKTIKILNPTYKHRGAGGVWVHSHPTVACTLLHVFIWQLSHSRFTPLKHCHARARTLSRQKTRHSIWCVELYMMDAAIKLVFKSSTS